MANSKLIRFEFDPFDWVDDIELTNSERRKLEPEIKDYILKEILNKVAEGKSPVAGYGKFKKLDKDYIKIKKAEGGTVLSGGGSNLELQGDLLESVKIVKQGSKLVLTVSKSQEGKADGHNNFSGESELPLRRFIPNAADEETFKRDIINGVKELIRNAAEE